MEHKLLHILHADDDEEDRWIFQDGLNECDATIRLTQFGDGSDLLQYIEKVKPDSATLYAIICDMQMTFTGGLGVLTKLKLLPDWSKAPVIIFSTSSMAEDIRICMNEGAQAFYSKPSTFLESRQVISEIVWLCKNTKSLLTSH